MNIKTERYGVRGMGKRMGSEKLGSFYTGKKARKRREWRGIKDTLYDYAQWLRIWGVLIALPQNPIM